MERSDRLANSLTDDGRYRLLIQAVTDYAIYMLDPDGHRDAAGTPAPSASRAIGRTRSSASISRASTPRRTARDGAPAARARDRARARAASRRKAGACARTARRFWANVVIDPIRDDDGELIGFAKITRDITERARSAASSSKRRARRCFQSQKMEAIGQLTGGIAHDFNNLLMAVLGSLELLRKRLPERSDAHDAARQRHPGRPARRVADPAHARLRAPAGAEARSRRPVAELVRGMTDLLQRSLGPSVAHRDALSARAHAGARRRQPARTGAAQSRRECARRHAGRRADRHRGARARHPSPATATALKPGAMSASRVTDTGEGMDEETLARAIEPFFTTKGVGKGTGLGLSMVHGLAEQSGGRFVLQSRKGEGTTAELWLPVRRRRRSQIEEASALPRSANGQRRCAGRPGRRRRRARAA